MVGLPATSGSKGLLGRTAAEAQPRGHEGDDYHFTDGGLVYGTGLAAGCVAGAAARASVAITCACRE